MKKTAFNIPNIYESLCRHYLRGTLTVEEIAVNIYRAGLKNYIPGEFETLKIIGIY